MLIVAQWYPVPAEPGKTIVQVRKTVQVCKTGGHAPATGRAAATSIRRSSE
jgi:hypothetical protein